VSGRRNAIPGEVSPGDPDATDPAGPVDVSEAPADETDPQDQVNGPLTADPLQQSAPEPVPVGFVRMRHDGIGATADVPDDAVDIHRGRGWCPADHTVPEED
jgi:hypothetical protein